MNRKILTLSLLFVIGASAEAQILLHEGFNETATMTTDLKALGWAFSNQSDSADLTNQPDGWFPGSNFAVPPATEEGTNQIAANFQASNGQTGAETISTWMLTPTLGLANGEALDFWTRSLNTAGGGFADRMQVRMSTAGASVNTGVTSSDVGDFTNLLLDIDPTLVITGPGAYPVVYTHFIVTLAGLGSPTNGRFALRYFVANGGPIGVNSNAIVVDNLTVTAPAPEPATIASLALGIGALLRRRRTTAK